MIYITGFRINVTLSHRIIDEGVSLLSYILASSIRGVIRSDFAGIMLQTHSAWRIHGGSAMDTKYSVTASLLCVILLFVI